jgi:hypothetical protein
METTGSQRETRRKQQGDSRDTTGSQRETTRSRQGNKRDTNGKRRKTKGKQQGDKGRQRETKGKQKETKVNIRLKVFLLAQPVPKGSTAEVGGRMWARRWRAKWRARHGRLGLVDDISLAEKQDKAMPFYDLDGFQVLVFGPRKRDRFWAQIPRPKMVSPFSKSQP